MPDITYTNDPVRRETTFKAETQKGFDYLAGESMTVPYAEGQSVKDQARDQGLVVEFAASKSTGVYTPDSSR